MFFRALWAGFLTDDEWYEAVLQYSSKCYRIDVLWLDSKNVLKNQRRNSVHFEISGKILRIDVIIIFF